MARKPRGLLVNALVHMTSRGNRGAPIFVDDADRLHFLRLLEESVSRQAWQIHAYCLMSNHFHLLAEAADVPASVPIQRVLQLHAQHINRRHGFRGHLFGDRFWAQCCDTQEYGLELVRYIHLNPVRARLVATPDEYAWSSHRIYLGWKGYPWVSTALMDWFGRNPSAAAWEYMVFMQEGVEARAGALVFE